jgi:hypothetical protein
LENQFVQSRLTAPMLSATTTGFGLRLGSDTGGLLPFAFTFRFLMM